jgi:hypothetical protein
MNASQVTRHNATYAAWMHAADRFILSRLGVSIYDLADFCSRDLYEDGASAEEAVKSRPEVSQSCAATLSHPWSPELSQT